MKVMITANITMADALKINKIVETEKMSVSSVIAKAIAEYVKDVEA